MTISKILNLQTVLVVGGSLFLLSPLSTLLPGNFSLWPGESSPTPVVDVAAGKLLFEETAGDVGCASCHGMNAKDEGLAPDIRGADTIRVTDSLKNTGDMADIAMTEGQVTEIVAYLATLAPKK